MLDKWAKNEIEIACKRERGNKDPDEWDYGCACYASAYKAFKSLLRDEHSGMSIKFTQAILNRLINGKPLTAIEDTPDEWNLVTDGKYQATRMSSLFKDVDKSGTTYTDIDRFVCIDINNASSWTNGFISRILNKEFPIELPYYPYTDPYKVYVEEVLSDKNNGDFDTLAIYYVIDPKGNKVQINRFFKENEDSFEEIDKAEFKDRKAHDLRSTRED